MAVQRPNDTGHKPKGYRSNDRYQRTGNSTPGDRYTKGRPGKQPGDTGHGR